MEKEKKNVIANLYAAILEFDQYTNSENYEALNEAADEVNKAYCDVRRENKELVKALKQAVARLDDGSAWADDSEEFWEMKEVLKKYE